MAQAVEAAQLAEDLKVQLEHTQTKLREIQASVLENRTARERESVNLKKAQVHVHVCCRKVWDTNENNVCETLLLCCTFQEDLSRLRRKLEKQKKVEVYTDADEILQEEINQYKVSQNLFILYIY